MGTPDSASPGPFDYTAAVDRAKAAAASYYQGRGGDVTDAEYDRLLEQIAAYEQTHPAETIEHELFTAVAGGTPPAGDVPHPSPMLSLDKVKTEADIRRFLTRVIGAAPDARDQAVSVQPKLDGMAVRAVYRTGVLTQVVTRGNGQAGEDITSRVTGDGIWRSGLPDHIHLNSDFEVRGELLMSVEDFRVTNANRVGFGKTAFANPRNATAGTVRNDALGYEAHLTFVTYDHEGMPAGAEDSFLFADQLLPESTGGVERREPRP